MNPKKKRAATTAAGSPKVVAPHGPSASPPRRGATRREWRLRLVTMIAAPVIFFTLIELVLRLFGCGHSPDFFVKNSVISEHTLVENPKFSRLFFPPQLARTPHSLAFLPAKPKHTLRIFVFGESAAEGDPAPAFGFARILEVMLRDRNPGLNIEVINTAITAINSNVIRPVAREAAGYSGDVWVIYMGNNEVVGPFGAGTIFGTQVPGRALIHGNVALQSTRTGQLLNEVLQRISPDSALQSWEGMEMFLKQQVRQSDPRMSKVYGHFEQNLSDIIGFGVDSGAKVIVSTVGSNLRDCPPFASLHPAEFSDSQKVEWNKLYEAALALEREGKQAEAAAEFQRSEAVDSQFAELHFRRARCLAQLGRLGEARQAFVRARDLDTLRFRADSRINEIIRQAARCQQGHGVWLADAAQALARATPEGVPGNESFYEHVHPTFAGNYVIAKELAGQIVQALPDTAVATVGGSRAQFLSREECERRLALSDCDRLQIAMELATRIGRPPFTQQLNHSAQQARWDQVLADLRERERTNFPQVVAIYKSALQAAESDWQLHANAGAALFHYGDKAGALTQLRRAVQLLPHRLQTYDMIGNLLLADRKLEEAANCYRGALNIDPNFIEGHIGLGRVWLAQNAGTRAIQEFQRVVKLQPRSAWALDLLGQALLQLGQPAESEKAFRAALAVQPNFTPARLNLAISMLKRGESTGTVGQLREVLSLDPQNARARQLLETVEGKSKINQPP